MRQDGRPSTPWHRKHSKAKTKAVFLDLQRREMRDLETCRQVWEQDGDPLALCVALIQTDLPEWLKSALLVQLTDGIAWPSLREGAWRRRTRDAVDAIRAVEFAGVRSHPTFKATREMAFLMGEHFTRTKFPDLGTITAAGMTAAYARVCRGLANQPWRYYSPPKGTDQRIKAAWTYMQGVLEAALKAARTNRPIKKMDTLQP